MDNRFKFRVWWCPFEGDGFYITEEESVCIWSHGEVWQQGSCDDIRDECTIEQCTGMKDKNGTLIYEGDIIEIKLLSGNRYKSSWKPGGATLVVVFSNTRTCFQCTVHGSMRYGAFKRRSVSLREYNCSCYEVIGNIHQNGDLLNE